MLRIVFALLSLSICVWSNQWNYGHLGPDIWSDYYPLCAGQSQSPINILTACTAYRKLRPFKLTPAREEKHYFKLTNNGHTVVAVISDEYQQSPVTLTGGGLNGTFEFVNFHLHWGENYKSGSEHHINGIKYAGEIHFVYVNPLTSQMAVLGIFMESYADNQQSRLDKNARTRDEWQKYFNTMEKIRSVNDSIVFEFDLQALMSSHISDYWRYEGSLTTPPCSEGVIWTIFKRPIVFLENQFQTLRDNILFHDYRGPQPVYNRTVYRSFLNETLSSVPDYNKCSSDIRKPHVGQDSFIFGFMHCSTQSFSFFLLISYCVLTLVVVVYCKVRYAVRRKKYE